jgi:hypothetical protein
MMEHHFSYSELMDMNMGELLLYNKEVSNIVAQKNREIEKQQRKR